MENCKKNERKMYYALYKDKIPILDENGFDTFDYKVGYENPVMFKGSLTSGSGDAENSPFGTDAQYDRIIRTCDTKLPIDINTIIWVRNEPKFCEDGTVDAMSADFRVSAPVVDTLNTLRIAISYRLQNESVSPAVTESIEPVTIVSGNEPSPEDDGF